VNHDIIDHSTPNSPNKILKVNSHINSVLNVESNMNVIRRDQFRFINLTKLFSKNTGLKNDLI